MVESQSIHESLDMLSKTLPWLIALAGLGTTLLGALVVFVWRGGSTLAQMQAAINRNNEKHDALDGTVTQLKVEHSDLRNEVSYHGERLVRAETVLQLPNLTPIAVSAHNPVMPERRRAREAGR